MQVDIDVRDLRINDLVEKYESEGEGNHIGNILGLNIDTIENRVKFLISLLERCRDQLEKEANKESYEENEGLFSKLQNIRNEQFVMDPSIPQSRTLLYDSLADVVHDYFITNIHSYSEDKEINKKI